MTGFLVINPRSGKGVKAEDLRDAAEARGIDTHVLGPDDDPAELARAAPDKPLGVAGGDGSRRRFCSRSSPPLYGCSSRHAEITSRVCGNASSSSGTSSGANHLSSATSSAGSGIPSTMRAVQ